MKYRILIYEHLERRRYVAVEAESLTEAAAKAEKGETLHEGLPFDESLVIRDAQLSSITPLSTPQPD